MSGAAGDSPVKLALREILRLKQELARERERPREAVALVGMGVRFPGGVDTVESYWDLLAEGRDSVGPIPEDRWGHTEFYDPDQNAPGRYYVRTGGFLKDVDQFDPEFFGIAPVEAMTMDPQQRLLLETSWEALEHAGLSPSSLRGSRTGVFVGVGANDYQRMVLADPAPDTHASTGTAASVAAGRIAYVLGLRGPALSVDTACSSSLVAVHLACRSLREGESETALAAGVSLMLSPGLTVNFCRAGMLSREGRCSTFDARADGYVRSEGCAVVVLKLLRDALRDGDRIHAVIRGSAVNQDGRSSGLTAPSGPAQEAVLRDALSDAGLRAREVGYLEAHGTGTPLGDPIELQAAGAVFGEERPPDSPLLVGSVKTNLGHLEAAAGLAGLIKAALALEHGEIPPHLHFQEPNPHIPWADLTIEVPTRRMAWPAGAGPRRAGVSAFGFSGTNAHVLLEEPPGPATGSTGAGVRSAEFLLLSAPDRDGLRDLAGRFVHYLGDTPAPFADVAWTTVAGRTHFPERLGLVAGGARDAKSALERWLADESAGAAGTGPVATLGAGRLAHVALAFPDSGEVDAEAALRLAREARAFGGALDRCDGILRKEHDVGLLDALARWAAEPTAPRTPDLVQPAIFAVQWSLGALWTALGVKPPVVVGAGVGEYVAAQMAGAFTLEDALALVVARGRSAARLVPQGASIRGGDPEPVELQEALSAATLRSTGAVQFVSGTTGTLLGAEAPGQPGYWLRQARAEARYTEALEAVVAQGVDVVLTLDVAPAAAHRSPRGDEAPLSGGLSTEDPWRGLLSTVLELGRRGFVPSAPGLVKEVAPRPVALPGQPFRRRRFWYEPSAGAAVASPAAVHGGGMQAGIEASSAGVARSGIQDNSRDGTERWEATVAAGAQRAEWVPMGMDIHAYPRAYEVLNALTLALGRNALVELGAFTDAGHEAGVADTLETTGIRPAYVRIVQRLLDAMADSGELERTPAGYRTPGGLIAGDTSGVWARFEEVLRHDPPLANYLRHSGGLLTDVLRGRVSALETLFPNGSFDLAVDLYHNSVFLRYVNGMGAAALSAHIQGLPGEAAVRVLEIGAGTGGTTAHLVSVLPPARTEYLFTDVSEIFLDHARTTFADRPWFTTAIYDLEADPGPQGVAPGRWDVVVAANVVHAARDLRAALRRIRTLLRPGGMLLLVESTGHHPWHDISTGLIEGWQHFEDDLRTDTPLLTPDMWLKALAEAGFEGTAALPGDGSPAEVLRQHILLARNPEGANPRPSMEVEAVSAATAHPDPAPAAPGAFVDEVARAPESSREEMAALKVRECVMEVLRSDPQRPPGRDARLMDLGLDSLMALRLRNLLQERMGLTEPLPATLAFDHPTIRHVARFIVGRLGSTEASPLEEVAARGDSGEGKLAGLTDAEVEAMLLERLDSGEFT